MKIQKILLIEDDQDFQNVLKKAIVRPNLHVDVVSTAAEAERTLNERKYDLILLDLNLPDRSGFDFLTEFAGPSGTPPIPIILVTGKIEVTDKVTAFSLGVDDYIVKPFHPLELRARIEAKLRKNHQDSVSPSVDIERLHIHPLSHQAFMDIDGKTTDLELSQLEFKLLYHLAKHPEQVFSREQLLSAVWGSDVHVFDRTVDVHVCSLRKKLGEYSDCIEAVPRVGYRMVLPHARKAKRVA